MKLDDKLHHMLRDLRRALSEAISESSEVSRTLRKIREEGYSLYLLVDCKREANEPEQLPAPSPRTAGGEPLPQVLPQVGHRRELTHAAHVQRLEDLLGAVRPVAQLAQRLAQSLRRHAQQVRAWVAERRRRGHANPCRVILAHGHQNSARPAEDFAPRGEAADLRQGQEIRCLSAARLRRRGGGAGAGSGRCRSI